MDERAVDVAKQKVQGSNPGTHEPSPIFEAGHRALQHHPSVDVLAGQIRTDDR